MNIKSLYPIIVVNNMEETVKFYADNMGFKVKHDVIRKDGGHVIVVANEAGLEIELMDKMDNGAFKLEPGLYGFRMNVDDIEKASEELKNAGVKVLGDPVQATNSKNLPIIDNNGVHITLMEHNK